MDDATGLYNLRARSYDPATGRFLSQDTYGYNPSDPSQFNRYGYTANNPVNFADPSGLFAIETGMLDENANNEGEAAGAMSENLVGDEFSSEGDALLEDVTGRVPLKEGTELPKDVKWTNVDKLKHPDWNPPDVASKIENAINNLKQGFDPNHPILVNIEHDGTWLVFQGNHRLYVIAVILGYTQVPVRFFGP